MKQSMKGILTGAAGVMVFLPWTILLLRRHEWALKSPAAEITMLLQQVLEHMQFL